MQDQIKQQINRIKARGATYVDTRWYPLEETNSLLMMNGNLKEASSSSESGLGVRVLYNGAWGFAASSDVNNLTGLYNQAWDNAVVASERVTMLVRLAEKDIIQAKFSSPNKINPFEVPLADKMAFLSKMDQLLDQPGVAQRYTALTFMRKQILFFDSEGSEIEKLITEVFSTLEVSGVDKEGGMHERKFKPYRRGDSRGWETIDAQFFSENAERIVREMNGTVNAIQCPVDDRSVILLPGIMYLQTHETIGHPVAIAPR